MNTWLIDSLLMENMIVEFCGNLDIECIYSVYEIFMTIF
jgi:hypothetical protein